MDMAFSLGQMEENMMEIILTIRNTDMAYSLGLMEENMKDHGRMENNMVKEHIHLEQEQKNMECGMMAKELTGSPV